MLIEGVPAAVAQVVARLAEPKPMRRGSVSERSMKCGQKGCRCQVDPKARHGPYYSLTRSEGGKTQSRYLSAEQAEAARRQVEAYWQACERWADAQLEAPEAATEQGAAKKGGSKKPSRRKSAPRSKRS